MPDDELRGARSLSTYRQKWRPASAFAHLAYRARLSNIACAAPCASSRFDHDDDDDDAEEEEKKDTATRG
jgi:hypothetical protein